MMLIAIDFQHACTCTVMNLHHHYFLTEQMQKLETYQTYYATY